MAERRSALQALSGALAAAGGEAVTIREVPFLAQVDVRAGARDAAALGLPLEPNTTAPVEEWTALWLGPDEWLVVGADGQAGAIERHVLDHAGDGGVSVVDLSANRTVLDLHGPGARDVLRRGCALDLHPRAFAPGQCAQTGLARAQVILEALDGGVRVFVRPSFATYLAAWLLDALRSEEDDRATPVLHDPVLEVPAHGT